MPEFHERVNKTIKSFEVTVYEVDGSIKEETDKLENYLVNKIKKIKIFSRLDEIVSMLKVPNIGDDYAEKFKNTLKDACNPAKHKVAAFDIRRSYITEFMSELLLEKKFNCVFYEQADKRLNADAATITKHTPGVDVIGVQVGSSSIKFVVCEVKASKSKIPCTETESLLNDVKTSMDLSTQRLSREILNYITYLKPNDDDDILANVVDFLLKILHGNDDEGYVMSNIIFFPFLIRQNDEIIPNSDVGDFGLFGEENFGRTSIKGIIWSFNNDINTFCDKIWDEALSNV